MQVGRTLASLTSPGVGDDGSSGILADPNSSVDLGDAKHCLRVLLGIGSRIASQRRAQRRLVCSRASRPLVLPLLFSWCNSLRPEVLPAWSPRLQRWSSSRRPPASLRSVAGGEAAGSRAARSAAQALSPHLTRAPAGLGIVVCTYDRCDALARCLASLIRLEPPPDGTALELVVVDNNSSDGTRALVESWRERSPHPVRYVFERRQGLAYARNAGVRTSTAPLIACTDDDCLVAPDWSSILIEELRS